MTPVTLAEINSPGNTFTLLPGRTVSLTANVTASTGITLEEGSILDLQAYSLAAVSVLQGKGLLRIGHSYFPTVTTNPFVQAGGGTVEYAFAGEANLPAQSQYNHLLISKGGTAVAARSVIGQTLTIHGDLTVREGTFQIGKTGCLAMRPAKTAAWIS